MQTFAILARWTRWANDRLYEAVANLDRDEYFAPRASAFGSIHKTLNHLVVTDRIWLSRLTGVAHNIPALDHEICLDFAALRSARRVEDRRIVEVVDQLISEQRIKEPVSFCSMDGTPRSMLVSVILAQLFLHHAHHRGQVHTMLAQTAIPPPALDLTYFPGAAA